MIRGGATSRHSQVVGRDEKEEKEQVTVHLIRKRDGSLRIAPPVSGIVAHEVFEIVTITIFGNRR